jgi:hypothetical protein
MHHIIDKIDSFFRVQYGEDTRKMKTRLDRTQLYRYDLFLCLGNKKTPNGVQYAINTDFLNSVS